MLICLNTEIRPVNKRRKAETTKKTVNTQINILQNAHKNTKCISELEAKKKFADVDIRS